MARTKQARRIQMLVFGGLLLAGAAGLVGFLAQDAIAFFKSPSELTAEAFSPDQLLRVGGLVVEGSKTDEGPTHRLRRHRRQRPPCRSPSPASCPTCSARGRASSREGYWRNGAFEATEVLAKHDEKYMPREVADALKAQGHWEPDGPAGKTPPAAVSAAAEAPVSN